MQEISFGKITPRDYQLEAYNACCENIRHYQGAFFVEASVGAGKTIIMGCILARAQKNGLRALVLARQGELVEQNSETFWAMDVKNSIFSASLNIKSQHYPIIVGTEGTIARALPAEMKESSFDLLIIDECHQVDFLSDDSQYMQIISTLTERNPKLRVIGMTGSPYRGDDDIVGDFWVKKVYSIGTEFLVRKEFLVPTIFGFGDDSARYDLSEFTIKNTEGHSDYSKADLLSMQRLITKDCEKTKAIIAEVVALTADRNAVLITGAGKKHLEQIAAYLPENSWIIITDSTNTKERRESLKAVSRGDKKYILQIGCLTTGYDEPLIDTSVLMRKIGSLTLLTQLLGRGMRLLKPQHLEKGIEKKDHLVLDYTETMMEMAGIYENPILEKAQAARAFKDQLQVECPLCKTQNSAMARRCIGEHNGARCEWFWSFEECKSCGVKNDKVARACRGCGEYMRDPALALLNKHYTDEDFIPVYRMTLRHTRDAKGVIVDYLIHDSTPTAKTWEHRGEAVPAESVSEVFYPKSDKKWLSGKWKKDFLGKHLHRSWWGKVAAMSADIIIKNSALFDTPTHITHRRNEEGKSIIYRKKFLSGREG
jgi:superfamily II DNA or RNA helicase